jgi:transposase-like protein
MRRQQHSADQWGTWLEEFERGDFTIAEFCKLKGVCTNSFYQWRRKLTASDAAPPFVPVEVATSPQVEIDLPGGTTIRVPNDSASLRPILQVLCELDANR